MNYKNYNDYELIYMVRENDDNSYNVLYEKYTPIIRKIAYDYYKSYSSYGFDLEDFIQEGYVGFQKAVRKYDERINTLFYTFVILCIHRTLISFCQTISRDKKNISNKYLLPLEDVYLSDGVNYEEDYVNSVELFKNIWKCIYCCSFDEICIFELRWNHFKFVEISQLMDAPIKHCQALYKKSLYYIQNRLSNLL